MMPGNYIANSDSDRLQDFFGAYRWRFDGISKGSEYFFKSEDAAKYCYSYLFMLEIPAILNRNRNEWTVLTPQETNEPQVSALLLIVEEQKENERKKANELKHAFDGQPSPHDLPGA